MLFALKDIFRIYRVNAIKNLSQNFIFDEKLLSKTIKLKQEYYLCHFLTVFIAERIASVPDLPIKKTAVVEVGPAAGNLSRALLGRGFERILLVEKDQRFKPALEVGLFERSIVTSVY